MTKASVSVAYKLECGLGMPAAKPINIFEYREETDGFLAAARRVINESRFLQFVIRKLLQFNFAVSQIERAPFDFVAKTPKNETSLLVAVAGEREQNLGVRSEEIISISKIVEAQPIFVTDSRKVSVDNIPLLRLEDFEKIKCCEDLMAKL
jgi:predicted transcriptional regulator